MQELSIGFSPCPNDTYIFCGLVNGKVPLSSWQPQPVILEDVETLNEWAMQGRLDTSCFMPALRSGVAVVPYWLPDRRLILAVFQK